VRPNPRRLLIAILLLEILACVLHTGVRCVRGLGAPWPAPLELPQYEPIAERVRGEAELGLAGLDRGVELRDGEPLRTLYRLQNVIVPTVLARSPRALTLVVRTGAEEPRLPPELQDRVELPVPASSAVRGLELAGRERVPGSARNEVHPVAPAARAGAILLALALAVGLYGWRRAGARGAALALVVLPCVLGLASAAADATALPGVLTWGITLLLLALVLPRLPRAREAPQTTRELPRFARVAAVGLALLGLVALVLELGLAPEGAWDAQAMFSMRARFVVTATDFWAPFADVEGLRELHPDYPPLVPFALAGAWRLVGGTSVLAAPWLALCFALGVVGLVVESAARRGGALVGLTALALLLACPRWLERIAEQGCDVPLGALIGAAAVLWIDGRSRAGALWAGALLGCALLTKNEGALLVLAFGGCSLIHALGRPAERLPAVRWLAAGALPGLVLLLLFQSRVPTNDLVAGWSLDAVSMDRARTIAARFGVLATRPQEYKAVFALATVALVAWAFRRRSGPAAPAGDQRAASLALALLAVVAGFFLVYLGTPHDLDWHLTTSVGRLFAQLYPATVVLGLTLGAGAAGRDHLDP